jgi:glycosyltransferase involved in cell wall biosynthesis
MARTDMPFPRVGALTAWFDPSDPAPWSGLPRAVIDELQRLGVYAGWRNVTPWSPAAKVLLRWSRLTRRQAGWTRRPEMRALARISDTGMRLTTPRDVDGWVHFLGASGPVVRTRYATLFEMSPAQLGAAGPSWAASLGYPHSTPSRMAWVVRRQVAAHKGAFACCMATHWAADSLMREHGIPAKKIRIVGYGRNAEVAPPPDRDWSVPRFLFIGRDWGRKNGDAVVRCFLRVREEVPAARLDVVGGPEDLAGEGITAHGNREQRLDPSGRRLLADLITSATCLVGPSFVEAFGLVYVEAAAAGVPSIAGSIGGTSDSVGEGGRLVDPHDDEAIYRAMRELCDPDVARALGALALERSRKLTWSATAQRILRSLELGPIPGVELADFL